MNSRMLEAAGVSPGWLMVAAAGVAVVSYCLGCFNGAVVVSRYILRNDVRNYGSGNAGLTNFYRVFGGPLTLLVILSDVLKAVFAVLFAVFIAEHISPELVALAKYWGGAFCIVGHMYPCTFQFRGGKGVLSGGTIALMIDWRVALVVWGGFIILAVATKYVSLGSCWAGVSFPFVSGFVYRDPLIILLAAIMGGLLLWKHRKNMVRIVNGTESKFALHKKASAEAGPDQIGDNAGAPAQEDRALEGAEAAHPEPAPKSDQEDGE